MSPQIAVAPDSDRLLGAAADIEQLARSDVSEAKFFGRFLQLLTAATDSIAGSVWMLDADGVLEQCAVSSRENGAEAVPRPDSSHVQTLLSVIQQGRPIVDPPHDSPRLVHASPVRMYVPIRRDGRGRGVIELSAAETTPRDVLDERLRFVEEMGVYAARFMAWRAEADSSAAQLSFWSEFERVSALMHRSLDPAEVAATVVNEARRLLGCDRVSLAVRHGGGARVLAISGQQSVNRRSNLVRALDRLAMVAIKSGREVLYCGHLRDVPPQVEKPLADYLSESGARMVRVIPLASAVGSGSRRKEDGGWKIEDGQSLHLTAHCPLPTAHYSFAAIVIEQLSDSWLTPVVARRSELIARHAAMALANARRHHGIFLLPAWLLAGRILGWFRGRNLMRSAAVAALFGGIVCGMAFITAPYRVEGTGKLMPVLKRDAFAPRDGVVADIFVAGGQQVERGQPLLRIRSEDLETQLLTARTRLDERNQLLTALKAELGDSSHSRSAGDTIRLRGRLAQTEVEIRGLRALLAALHEQIDALTLRAPIAGTVVTFQLDQLLANRPVGSGDLLLEVMDETGPWQLELDIPEHRMGHLLKRQQTAASPLPVEFVMATAPEELFRGTLQELATRAAPSPADGVAVQATVAVDAARLPDRKIGAEVSAKIECGQRSLAYVLFGDVVEFVQRRLW